VGSIRLVFILFKNKSVIIFPLRSDANSTNQAGVPKAGWRISQHLKALKLYYIMWLLQYTKKVSPRLPAPLSMRGSMACVSGL